jgi:predicted GIY-YIG superfamily endonuclease/GNAT superfamily N-acetyltransferase
MERAGYIYVLHFDRPLSHAQHYIGCTADPRARLIQHAQGRGANIVRAAGAEGIGFRLSGLGITNVRCMRRIERQVKDWHGTRQFCSCCTPDPRGIPGTRSYPIEAIPFPRDSGTLAMLQPKVQEVAVRLTVAGDGLRLSEQVRELSRYDKDALGFIPAGGSQGVTVLIEAGRMAVCHIDGQLAGFCAFTENAEAVTIHQCCVADEHRGCGVGRELVTTIRQSRSGKPTSCKVREDLPANEFWTRIGFAQVGTMTHATSGMRLHIYSAPPAAEKGSAA